MTPDQAYELGYNDALAGKAASASLLFDSNYNMGYEDGKGQRASEHASDADFTVYNAAPEGFAFSGEKRIPRAFEWYLSKQGNPTYLKRERKNNQTRHILTPTTCICHIDTKRCGIHA